MFSINSLDGNSFFDIGLKYRQMQIKELGDESYDAPSELRDTEKIEFIKFWRFVLF